MRRALLAVCIVALAVPGAAGAHATLMGASPAEQSSVESAPTDIAAG